MQEMPGIEHNVSLEDVEDYLGKFPAELIPRLSARMQGSSPKDQLSFLKNAFAQRELLKIPRFRSASLRTLDRVPAGLPKTIETIRACASEIDHGHWGKIMRCAPVGTDDVSHRQEVLYKIPLCSTPSMHNDLEAEAGFLAELHKLSLVHADLRVGVPEPYYFVSDGPIEALAQEDISHAISIKNILDQKIPIPDTFPQAAAFDALRAYIQKINDLGYYHRDLREGNIMLNLNATIDGTEPLLYVIDMGFCVYAPAQESAQAQGFALDINADRARILIAEKLVRQYASGENRL